jgi:hypothetical protein
MANRPPQPSRTSLIVEGFSHAPADSPAGQLFALLQQRCGENLTNIVTYLDSPEGSAVRNWCEDQSFHIAAQIVEAQLHRK